MRNKYAGICYRCGERVEPGDGHFERHKHGWRIQHASCAIKHRGTSHEHSPPGTGAAIAKAEGHS